MWEERVKKFIDKETALEAGTRKLYMLLWGQCIDVIKVELKSVTGYESFSKAKDPIELLKAIRSVFYSFRDQKKLQPSVWRA